MKCPKCAVEIADASQFCPQCGAKMGDEPGGVERVQQNLAARPAAASEPEKEVWQGSFSPKAMYGAWLLCAVVTVVALVVGMLFLAAPLAWTALVIGLVVLWLYPLGMLIYQRMSIHYRLTTQRFFHERGFLRRVTDRIEVIDMDDISVEQGLVERFLGVGTIRVTSSDSTHPKLVLPGIDDVTNVAGQIDNLRRQERMRRGLFVESV